MALGCGGEPPGEELLSSLPHAEVRRVDSDLLFSERVSREGWGLTERDTESAFRWAIGAQSEVVFHSLATDDVQLFARARGAIAPGFTVQPVRVLLNGVEIAGLEVGADWTDVSLLLPRQRLRRGRNHLVLKSAHPLQPTAADREARPLAVCFRTLRLGPVQSTPEDQQPLRLDLGSVAVAERLVSGWSEPIAEGPDGQSSRWVAQGASLRLAFRTPADRRLTLTARRPESLAEQQLEVWLNGRQLVSHDLESVWSTFTVEAPREEWLAGSNLLALRFGTPLEAEDALRGAQVARLVVETVAEPALAAGRDQKGAYVRQPAGTWVDLFRRLPEGSPRILLAGGGRGGAAARVALDIEPEGGAATEAWRGEVAVGRPQSVDLSAWSGDLVRLRLSAIDGAVAWRRLELQGGRPQSPLASSGADRQALVVADERPNLLLYVIDTLRADHTSVYGYQRRTTPRLEELAGEGIVFDPAWANASWTWPGTVTLLTGALPSVHGAVNLLNLVSPKVGLLSETLQAAGYTTHAVVTNTNLREGRGTDRGWDDYRYLHDSPGPTESSAFINRELLPRLAELAASDRPFFVYLHSVDPHLPYREVPEHGQFVDPDYEGPIDGSIASVLALLDDVRRDGLAAHRADLEHVLGLYDGAVLHNDTRIGELVDAMAELGLLESTAILVTSDHGEEFLEHGGVAHGHSLYQELIRIPMVLRPPGGVAPRRVAGAQQVDVAAMLAGLAGVTMPPTSIGRNLLSGGAADRRPVFSEQEVGDRRLWSLVEGGMKLHYNRNATRAAWQGRETHELFDLSADAGEQSNLYTSRPILAGYLLERVRALAAQLPTAAERDSMRADELTEEVREKLRALGYLQ